MKRQVGREMEKSLNLKIRSGVHRSASIRLIDGIYTVGRSIDNDIVLSDLCVSDFLAEIHVSGQEISIKSVGNDVVVANTKMAPGTHAKWHSGILKLADVELDLDRPQLPPNVTVCANVTPARRKFANIALSTSAAAAFILCATSIAKSSLPFAPLYSGSQAAVSHTRIANPALQSLTTLKIKDNGVPNLSTEFGWQQLNVKQVAGGSYVAAGIVPKLTDLSKLRSHIALNKLNVDVSQVEVGEVLVEHAKNFLRDPSLEISYNRSNGLEVSGDRTFAASVQRVKLLRKELGSRIEVSDLSSHKLDKKDKRVVLIKLPLALTAVDAVQGYVEGDDGTKYFSGSKLSNGFLIERITSKAVYLKANGQSVVYELN
jgi:hypothetical protein